jgi:hypothetical protein
MRQWLMGIIVGGLVGAATAVAVVAVVWGPGAPGAAAQSNTQFIRQLAVQRLELVEPTSDGSFTQRGLLTVDEGWATLSLTAPNPLNSVSIIVSSRGGSLLVVHDEQLRVSLGSGVRNTGLTINDTAGRTIWVAP